MHYNEEELTETSYDNMSNDIVKKYLEPTILTNINIEKYFKKEHIQKSLLNNKLLQITDKGLYSITKYYDADWIFSIIKNFLKSVNISTTKVNIVDGTAGIGGNTINFAENFNKVYAIEINCTHFKVLNNNLNALSIENVTTFEDNFLNVLNSQSVKINSDIFFLDPPWGGKNYKSFKYFNLKIGKLPVYTIINMLFDKKFKYVILKAPHNLNLSPIYSNIKYENMNIHSNFKKNMIICIFY